MRMNRNWKEIFNFKKMNIYDLPSVCMLDAVFIKQRRGYYSFMVEKLSD